MNHRIKRTDATDTTLTLTGRMLRYAQYWLFIGLLSLAGNAAAHGEHVRLSARPFKERL